MEIFLLWTALRLCGKTELNCISEVRTKTSRLGRDKGWVQRFTFAKNGTKFRTTEADLDLLTRRSLQPVPFQKPGTLSGKMAEQGHADSEASAHWAVSACRAPAQLQPAGEASLALPPPVPP